MLSLFGDICLLEDVNQPCVRRYKNYSQNFYTRFPTTNTQNETKLIYNFVEYELVLKVSELQDKINTWVLNLYQINYAELNNIAEESFIFEYFSNLGGKISIQSKTVNFIDGIFYIWMIFKRDGLSIYG